MRLSACLLLALSPAAAADVLTLGLPGSGADFDNLSAALQAAEPGDQIRIFPGIFTASSTTISKGVEIIGSGPEMTFIQDINPFGASTVIQGLPADEAVHVSALSFSSVSSGPTGFGVTVNDCAGPVSFDGCRFQPDGPGIGVGSLLVDSCDLVLVSDSTLVSGDLSELEGLGSVSFPALRCIDSTLVVDRCELEGGSNSPSALAVLASQVRGQEGLVAVGSTVVVANSELRGGTGGGFGESLIAAPGGSGMTVAGGVTVLAGETRVVGADGTSFPGYSPGEPGIGLIVQSAAAVEVGPDVELVGGTGASGTAQTWIGPASADVNFPLDRFFTTSVENDGSSGSASANGVLRGEPGRTVLLFAGLGAAPVNFLPFVSGPLVLDPASPVQILTATLPAGGELAFSATATSPVVIPGNLAVFQGVEIDALTGLVRAGLPASTTLEF